MATTVAELHAQLRAKEKDKYFVEKLAFFGSSFFSKIWQRVGYFMLLGCEMGVPRGVEVEREDPGLGPRNFGWANYPGNELMIIARRFAP